MTVNKTMKRLFILTFLLAGLLLQSGCWYALAGRAAAKRIESGQGPVGQMVDELDDDSTDTSGHKTSATTSGYTSGGNY